MATTTNLDSLVINYLTQEQYDEAQQAGTLNANQLYLTPDTGNTYGTVTSVGITNATNGGLSISGSPVTSSGSITVGHSNVLSSAQTTQAVYPIKIDKNGHISAYGSAITIPTKTSDLTNDSGFITSYTDEKLKWTASTSSNTYYPLQSTSTATTSTANTLNGISFYQYYDTAGGYRRLDLGNSTTYTLTGGAYGTIRLYGAAATYYGDLVPGVLGTTSGDGHISANRTWTLPNKTGTIALTSDVVSLSNYTDGSNVSYYIPFTNLTGSNHTLTSAMVSPNFKVVDSQMANVTSLYLGNDLDTSQTTYRSGILRLYSQTGNYTELAAKTDAAYNRTVYLPNSSDNPIILASTNDIPTKTSDLTNDSGFVTTDEKLKTSGISSGTSYLLMGAATSSAGTKQYSTQLSFTVSSDRKLLAIGSSGVKGALRIYSSTNSSYTDLLNSATAGRTITIPDATGTLALTSDIPSVYSSTNTGGYLTMATLPIYDGTVV